MGIPRGSERDDVGGTQRVGVPAHGNVATDGDDRVGLVVAPVQRALHDPVPEEKISAEAPNLRAEHADIGGTGLLHYSWL